MNGSSKSFQRHPGSALARALSKLGFASRSQAYELIKQGRVRVNGVVQRDAHQTVALNKDHLLVDDLPVTAQEKIYLMLNKPRGLVTTRSDEKGRPTVYSCLPADKLTWLAPVGRLDQASEGLLLFTNDTQWAARITAPETHLDKTYHVQVNCIVRPETLRQILLGVKETDGGLLKARQARLLRQGSKNCWLEMVLDEGRNRHIRRLLQACGMEVLRLVRVAIGPLALGTLPKGSCRTLTESEVRSLRK